MSEQPVIVDTSALISLLSDTDSLHTQALTFADTLRDNRQLLLIPAEVLAEALNVMRPRIGNPATVTIGQELLASPDIAVSPTPRDIIEQTLTKLAIQTGNASYIDCLVMATADHYHTRVIFGFDDTFRKDGYVLPAATLHEDAA